MMPLPSALPIQMLERVSARVLMAANPSAATATSRYWEISRVIGVLSPDSRFTMLNCASVPALMMTRPASSHAASRKPRPNWTVRCIAPVVASKTRR